MNAVIRASRKPGRSTASAGHKAIRPRRCEKGKAIDPKRKRVNIFVTLKRMVDPVNATVEDSEHDDALRIATEGCDRREG
jgi:hypothetical protein